MNNQIQPTLNPALKTDFYIESAITYFRNKVNLLIIEDDHRIVKSLESIFTSPLFNLQSVRTVKETWEKINDKSIPWHTWTLDLSLEQTGDCLPIVNEKPIFPFIIIFSAMHSMTNATDCLKKGVLAVYDKDPMSTNRLYDSVCKAAALGFVLKGKKTQNMDLLMQLTTNFFSTPDAWAKCACISKRQLDRDCFADVKLTAPKLMSLYYAIYYLLWIGDTSKSKLFDNPIGPNAQEVVICRRGLRFVVEKYGQYYNKLIS